MLEEKESFWKKKGFYASACVLLVGVMAVGALTYRKLYMNDSENQMMANIATEVPEETPGRISDAGSTAAPEQEAAQANAPVSKNTSTKEEVTAKEQTATKKTEKKKVTETKEKSSAQKNQNESAKAASTTANQVKLSFNEEAGLLWPVEGDVILKYSMSNTVYFKTLAQYKCNPGVVISAKVGTEVKAAADCRVTKIEKDDELGTVVTTNIGDNYTVSYGQLDNISVNKGDELKEGDVIGKIANPTKYYTEEGSNLYFQVKEGKNTVDPMLLLR